MVASKEALKARFIVGPIETRCQRLTGRFGFLGRCPRLLMNIAPLALNPSQTAATERHPDTPINARRFPRFHRPCLRGEKFGREFSRNRDQSPNDASPEVSLRAPAHRCLCCFSRRSAFLSGIRPRRRNRTPCGAPNRARARSCARVEQSAPPDLLRKFLQA